MSVMKSYAKRECFDIGGTLLVINSKTENDYVLSRFQNENWASFWLGINDKLNRNQWVIDSLYQRLESLTAPRYLNFHHKLNKPVRKAESAVFIKTGKWEKVSNAENHQFICQKVLI